jgi:hypothetical protein
MHYSPIEQSRRHQQQSHDRHNQCYFFAHALFVTPSSILSLDFLPIIVQ